MLDSIFRRYIEQGTTSSLSILLFEEDKLVYRFLEGTAIPGDPSSMRLTETTRLNIGSVTKTITGALVMKLQEDGFISLSDPVKKYLPWYAFNTVTILHLMTHTAGYGDSSHITWPENAGRLGDYMHKIYSIDRLEREPGDEAAYFTSGYSILMDIIQRVTNMSIEEYARAALFKPLGMNLTTYDAQTLQDNEVMLPWSAEKCSFYPPKTTPPTADSGLYTTAGDLMRFANMFTESGSSESIFSEASIASMMTGVAGGMYNRTPIFWMKGDKDAHGCFGTLASSSCVGHPGFSGCMMMIDPAYDVAGVILSNSANLHADWRNYVKIWDELYLNLKCNALRR